MRHELTGPTLQRPARETPAPAVDAPSPLPEPVQDADGRWRWEAPGDAVALALSVRSRDEALADRALRLEARLDASGRRVLPKEHLRKLISAFALPCAACVDVFFGGVYWHPRDAGGCNWSVGIMSGCGDRDACMACVLEAKTELRRRFAIEDEA